MSTLSVTTAGPSEARRVIDVITLAFSADPMARWSLPDAAQYLEVMPDVVAAFGGGAFAAGSAHLLDGGAGAALWLPPGTEPDGERLVSLMQAQAPAAIQDDLMQVFALMGQYHPAEPHWYLPLIGVDPSCQGQGVGGALMRHALARCDRDGLPAYLESSNPRNISLYLRHGFEPLPPIQVGRSPLMTPMSRKPR